MDVFSWIRAWLDGQAPRSPRLRRHRLQLESLEPRLAPATLWVSSIGDDAGGIGQLRTAIGAAASGDTIKFTGACNGQTITLKPAQGGQLAIAKNLTIDGTDQNITISGNQTGVATLRRL